MLLGCDLLKSYSDARIGEAYCRMNSFEWDEMFGDPPEGWNNMTDMEKYKNPIFKAAMIAIQGALTGEQRSMYWWRFVLGRSFDEWRQWYEKGIPL